MLYLLLAIFSSVSVSLLMRLSGTKAGNSYWMLSANYLVCFLIAAAFTGFDNMFPSNSDLGQTLFLGGINGFLYLISFVLYQRSVKKNGMVLSSTFMKLGLLIPIAVSLLAFRQIPSFLQGIGFCIALVAIVLIQFQGKASGSTFSLGLLLILLTGGGGNAMSEIYDEIGNRTLTSQFLLYTFLSALLLCLILTWIHKEKPSKYRILYGLAIGVPNYFSARFLLLSLKSVPAAVAHPTYSALSVCIVSVLGVCLFREKLTKRQWLGMAFILISLVLLNI